MTTIPGTATQFSVKKGSRQGQPTADVPEVAVAGRDVLCFSSIDWDFNWQGHQEVMAALAANGHRVLFIENTGIRAARFRDLPRIKHRFLRWWRSTQGFRQERPNLFVYSPVLLPFPHSLVAGWINRVLLRRSLERWMHATGFRRPVIWTFLPTKLVVNLIDRLDPALVVYYCIADFGQLSPRVRQTARTERMLLDRTDVVFVQGEELRQRCSPHRNIHVYPFGVNLETFDRLGEVAPEVASLKHPVIGYVGGLHRHMDLNLVERIAREIEGTVLLVGPAQTDLGRLTELPNVVLTGFQPHARIPQFVRTFDVGIIPYRLTEYTRTVYPTKLNEYLAMAVPVVTTDLPEVRRLNQQFGDVVSVAGNADEFIAAVRDVVASQPSPDEARRRMQVARHNSWSRRIAEMSELVQSALMARQTTGEPWEQTLRRLYRTARRRAARAAAALAVAFLILFYTPAVWMLAEPLRIVEDVRPSDVIVVFAGGVGESGKAGGGYQERVQRAAELYRSGAASWLVFSSGFRYVFREADVMRDLAVREGVPADRIVLEENAGNTLENVTFVHDILVRRGWRRVLLVSSPYHMRRAVLTWRKAAPDVIVVAAPAARSQFYAHGRGASLEQIRGILQEYAAIAVYWWRGWI